MLTTDGAKTLRMSLFRERLLTRLVQEIDADLERDREAADRIEADRADFLSR